MTSLNKVTLIGNLGADPEIRSLAGGGEVANLRVATSFEIVLQKFHGELKILSGGKQAGGGEA